MGGKRLSKELLCIYAETMDTDNRVMKVWGRGWGRVIRGQWEKKRVQFPPFSLFLFRELDFAALEKVAL